MMRTALTFIVILAVAGPAFAQNAAIAINPPDLRPSVGASFDVEVRVTNLEAVAAFDITVDFDPAILAFETFRLGDIDDSLDWLAIYNGLTAPGRFTLVVARIGDGSLTGDYTVLRLTFTSLAVGTSAITLGSLDAAYVGPIYVATGGAQYLQYEFQPITNGSVTVEDPTPVVSDPQVLAMSDVSGGAPLPAGSDYHLACFLRGIVPAVGNNSVRLEVEIKPHGTPFDGTVTFTGNLVNGGGVSEVAGSGLAPGHYCWRAKAVIPGVASSGWVNYGNGMNADFAIVAVAPIGIDVASDGGGGGGGGGCSVASPARAGASAFVALLILAAVVTGIRTK